MGGRFRCELSWCIRGRCCVRRCFFLQLRSVVFCAVFQKGTLSRPLSTATRFSLFLTASCWATGAGNRRVEAQSDGALGHAEPQSVRRAPSSFPATHADIAGLISTGPSHSFIPESHSMTLF
eukprot:3077326-Rhodomonas_salina.1